VLCEEIETNRLVHHHAFYSGLSRDAFSAKRLKCENRSPTIILVLQTKLDFSAKRFWISQQSKGDTKTMPLYSLVQIELETQPNRNTVLNNAIHGLIHHLLKLAAPEQDSNLPPATKLHDSQRQPVTLRAFQRKGSRLQLEITTLSADMERAVRESFCAQNVFGSDKTTLQGKIVNVEHFAFTLEQLRSNIRQHPAAKRIRVDFNSPTAFTHKRGTWASPHPSLLLKSLLARWTDFGGADLNINESCIVRAEPHIKTGSTSIGSSEMVAFEGRLDLELAGDAEVCWDLTTLIAFASLVNTGRRVAYGCGLVEATAWLNRNLELKLNPNLIR
jgi:CRISPR/Cas system endoribonuclease Cas6 (RAMP superfamily)